MPSFEGSSGCRGLWRNWQTPNLLCMAKTNLLAEVAELQNKIRKEIQFHKDEISILEGLLGNAPSAARVVGRGRPSKAPASPKARRSSKRTRRSVEEIQAEAQQVVQMVKSAGKDGIAAGDILAKFPKIFPSVKQYLAKYAKGSGVKAVGKKQFTKYVAG